MNGSSSTVDHHVVHREVQRSPQISQALLQGALEISAIFDKRVAGLKAEYERTIRSLVQERDTLLAKVNEIVGPEGNRALVYELEALRSEREGWMRDRAQWEGIQSDYANERTSWAQERETLLQERMKLEQDYEELRRAREGWEGERAALLQERERIQSEDAAVLQATVAAKDASIQELEARVKWLEAAQPASPAQPPTVRDQNEFNPLDLFQSPPRLDAFPAMSSTLGTLTPAKSPTSDAVPMQVRAPQPTSLLFEFEPELDAFFAPLLRGDAQVDDPAASASSPKSPTITLRGGQSPTITLRGGHSPTLTNGGARSPSVARSTTLLSSQPSTAQLAGPRRLVIRVPPAAGPLRKPIKSPVSPPTASELATTVHVPPSQGAPGQGSPTKSSDASTSSPSASSSSSNTS